MLAASEGKLYNCTYYIVQHWQYIVLLILPTCIHVDIEIPISQSVYQRNRSDKNDIIKYFISIYAPCDFQKQINTCPWFMSIVVTYFAQLICLCHTCIIARWFIYYPIVSIQEVNITTSLLHICRTTLKIRGKCTCRTCINFSSP